MFPGAGASVYYNEAGEPMGWDAPDDGPYDPYDDCEDVYPREDDEDDEDDEPERVPHGENHDYDATHQHTPECDSMTCYEKYVDLEYEGPEGPQVMTYEAWAKPDHDYEPGEHAHPMHTDPDCRICGGRKH